MCSGKCEYYQNCPVGYQKIEFEFEDVKFSCLTMQKLFDKFVEVKEIRNGWKEDPLRKSLSYFG